MNRAFLCVAAACMAAALTLSAKDIRFAGGYLTTIDDTQVECHGDDINFMFAYRFSDGSIHLGHNRGVHCVTETSHSDLSLDNGRTWKNGVPALGINSFEGLDGGKYQTGCWDLERSKVHTMRLKKYNDETGEIEVVARCEVELPESSQLLSHRDVVRLANGTLLATAYGTIEGHKKSHCFVLSSEDDGRTWKYLSTVADDLEGKTPEGPDEATIFQLRDGRVCVFYRDDGSGYLHQCFSSDNGATWSVPEAVTNFKGAASPNGRVLSDGTIVVISGRPNVYLLIDPSGTGKNYRHVGIYYGSGSSYASVLETAPNEILCVYDESNFGGGLSATPFSRIHASRFKLTINQDITEQVEDPLAAQCDYLFRPESMERMLEEKLVAPTYVDKAKEPANSATMEILSIPERPHPVLRLVSHGTREEENDWQNVYANSVSMSGTNKATIHCEFRLGDNGETRPQFHMAATIGSTPSEKGYLLYARFYLDKIELFSEDQFGVMPYDIGTNKFHAFVLEGDARTGIAKLYLEGGDPEKPLLTTKMARAEGMATISFGDGSANIHGSTDVSYFGWKLE